MRPYKTRGGKVWVRDIVGLPLPSRRAQRHRARQIAKRDDTNEMTETSDQCEPENRNDEAPP